MVVVGADVHKQTHTFVAVDGVGRELGQKTFVATTAGHLEAVRWARERFGRELKWAIEGCRHLSARLERDLPARVRLTRSGTRQLNAAIHRIAVTQIRLDGLGKTYYDKKKAEGMSTPEALRCLKRRLARVVFNHLTTEQTNAGTCLPAAA